MKIIAIVGGCLLLVPVEARAQALMPVASCSNASDCVEVQARDNGGGTISALGTVASASVPTVLCTIPRGRAPVSGCAATASSSATVRLSAQPDDRSMFWGWFASQASGLCPPGSVGDCELSAARTLTVSVSKATIVKASFILDALQIGTGPPTDYFPGPDGSGTVTSPTHPSFGICRIANDKVTAGQDTVTNQYRPLPRCTLGGLYRGERVKLLAVPDSLIDSQMNMWGFSTSSPDKCKALNVSCAGGIHTDTISFLIDSATPTTADAWFKWSPVLFAARQGMTGGGTVSTGPLKCDFKDGKYTGPDPTINARRSWLRVDGCTGAGTRAKSTATVTAIADEHSIFGGMEAFTGIAESPYGPNNAAVEMCRGIGNAYQSYCRTYTETVTFPLQYLEGPITITFLADPIRISETKNGDGGGNVTSTGSRMSCVVSDGKTTAGDSACRRGGFRVNEMVTLTAAPDAHSVFYGWAFRAIACRNSALVDNCYFPGESITIPGEWFNSPIAATFRKDPLRIAAFGNGGGTVTSDPGGLDCTIAGGVLSNDQDVICRTGGFARKDMVRLKVRADVRSMFLGWYANGKSGWCATIVTGDCLLGTRDTITLPVDPLANAKTHALANDKTGPDVWVVMDTAPSLKARFAADPLIVTALGTGSGTVTSDVGYIDCGITDGAASADGCRGGGFGRGARIALTAIAVAGSQFDGWFTVVPAISCATAPAISSKSIGAGSASVDCLYNRAASTTITLDKPVVMKASFTKTGMPITPAKRPPIRKPVETFVEGTLCDGGCFDAVVAGSHRAKFSGHATVEVDVVDADRGGDFRLVLRSREDEGHYVSFTRWGFGGRPSAGRSYSLANTCDEAGLETNTTDQFSAEYFVNAYVSNSDGENVGFNGKDGTLNIDTIGSQRITGRFSFVACRFKPDGTSEDTRVSGKFDALWQHE